VKRCVRGRARARERARTRTERPSGRETDGGARGTRACFIKCRVRGKSAGQFSGAKAAADNAPPSPPRFHLSRPSPIRSPPSPPPSPLCSPCVSASLVRTYVGRIDGRRMIRWRNRRRIVRFVTSHLRSSDPPVLVARANFHCARIYIYIYIYIYITIYFIQYNTLSPGYDVTSINANRYANTIRANLRARERARKRRCVRMM